MIPWQQTLVPTFVFYGLASLVAMGVAGLIAGLASLLHHLETPRKDGAK